MSDYLVIEIRPRLQTLLFLQIAPVEKKRMAYPIRDFAI